MSLIKEIEAGFIELANALKNRVKITDFNDHVNSPHITTDEKSKLSNVPNDTNAELAAKETPAGAQSKVDTGINNHENKTDPHPQYTTQTEAQSLVNIHANTPHPTQAQLDKIDQTETSLQLDARDIANRDRSNHTGTQTISTIDNLEKELTDIRAKFDIDYPGIRSL